MLLALVAAEGLPSSQRCLQSKTGLYGAPHLGQASLSSMRGWAHGVLSENTKIFLTRFSRVPIPSGRNSIARCAPGSAQTARPVLVVRG